MPFSLFPGDETCTAVCDSYFLERGSRMSGVCLMKWVPQPEEYSRACVYVKVQLTTEVHFLEYNWDAVDSLADGTLGPC